MDEQIKKQDKKEHTKPAPIRIIVKGQMEIDNNRGVIYFQDNFGTTALRICQLPIPIPKPVPAVTMLDITHMHGVSWKLKTKEPYPRNIIVRLRQRKDLDEDDTSRDKELLALSPDEAFDEVLCWEGIQGYTETIKSWINDIYGIQL